MRKSHRLGPEHQMPESACTSCGKLLTAVSVLDHEEPVLPSPGDFTVCITCGHIMGFNKDLSLRELTDAEMIEVAGNDGILAIQWARVEAQKKDMK